MNRNPWSVGRVWAWHWPVSLSLAGFSSLGTTMQSITDDWKKLRHATVLLLVVMILNVFMETMFLPYFYFSLVTRKANLPLLYVARVPEALSYAVVIWALLSEGPKFSFRRGFKIHLAYALFAVFAVAQGIMLYAMPEVDLGVHTTFPPFSLITGGLVLIAVIVYRYYSRAQSHHSTSRYWLGYTAAILGLVWWVALGFIYYPNVFTVWGFYPGFFVGHMYIEFAAQIWLAIVWIWHVKRDGGGGGEDITDGKVVRMYLTAVMVQAVALIFSIANPPILCLGAFLQINIDACIQSTFVSSWAFVAGVLLLWYSVKIYRMLGGSVGEDGSVHERTSIVSPQAAPQAQAETEVEVEVEVDESYASADTVTAEGEHKHKQRLKSKSKSRSCRSVCATCCGIASCLALPLLIMAVLILSFPFVYLERAPALVPNVQTTDTVEICRLEFAMGTKSPMCLWAVRDQLLSQSDAVQAAQIYLANYQGFTDYFSQWHFGWGMTNIYLFADSATRADPTVSQAYAASQAEADKIGGMALGMMKPKNDKPVTGFAHSLGVMAGHMYLVVLPDKDQYNNPQAWVNSVSEWKRRVGYK